MSKKNKHHWTYQIWVKVRGILAAMVVFAGVLVGLASLLLPFDALYKDKLVSFLEKQWKVSVAIEDIQGSWRGQGPHFVLQGLTLSGKQDVLIEETTLAINIYEYLYPGDKSGIDLRIKQADLAMIHSEKGANITINNDQNEQLFTALLDRILTAGTLQVASLQINVADDQGQALLAGLNAGFLLEQDQNHRAMSLRIGRDEAFMTINSVGKKQQQLSKDAEWHLRLVDFDLSQLNGLQTGLKWPEWVVNGEVWLEAVDGVVVNGRAQLDWQLDEQQGHIEWQHRGQNQTWQSDFIISDLSFDGVALKNININLSRQDSRVQLAADSVDLAWLQQWWPQPLPNVTLKAAVNDIRVFYDLTTKTWQQGEGKVVLDSVVGERFSVQSLDADLLWQDNELRVLLGSESGQIQLPEVFRGQMKLKNLSAQLSFSKTDDWSVNIRQFWCDCEDFLMDAQVLYQNTSEQPFMSLQAKVNDVLIDSLTDYWPHNVWKPRTIEWLDQSLKAGRVSEGYLFHQGDLVKQAFTNHLAWFESRAFLQDLSVKFNPAWPKVDAINGTAAFSGLGFSASLDHGHSNGDHDQGIHLSGAEVEMLSYKQPWMDLKVAAKSSGNGLLEYLDQTPVVKTIQIDDQITMSGTQWLYLDMQVPLKPGQEVKPEGRVTLDQAGLSTGHMTLTDIHGEVMINGYDLVPRNLKASLHGQAMDLSGVIKTKTPEGLALEVSLSGPMQASELLQGQQLQLPISGVSDWQIGITNPNKTLALALKSDLNGTAVDMPAPLNKTAEITKPFEMTCLIPCQENQVNIAYGDMQAEVDMRAAEAQLQRLWFGDAASLSEDESVLGGHIESLDIDDWLETLRTSSQASRPAPKQSNAQSNAQPVWQLPVEQFEVQVDELLFMARRFKSVSLQVVRLTDGYQIDVSNEDLKGRLLVADDLVSKGVVADFEYLKWKDAETADMAQSTKGAERLPDLHIYSKEFSYSGIPLGELRLELRNVIYGMQVEQMSLLSDTSNIQITGDWRAPNDSSEGLGYSEFDIVMTSEKIAQFLQSMDFDAPISNAQTLIKLEATWPGTPSMFDLKTITGTLDLSMGEGEVLDTKPGFGRVLGLFSLTNLPRRLILDFKDVMSDGLHFDRMTGHFKLAEGSARTADFLIEASAAKIRVNGDTNFANKTYDQMIMVEPQVGKTFPTIGAIAGGAVGAAAGFFVQGLLNKKLKSANRITYQVTGTWDEPVIMVLDNE